MNLKPRRASTGAPWEAKVGYCRAVRCGPHIWVSGSVAVDENGALVGSGDSEAQALQCFKVIEKGLVQLGADLSHVVRTRMYVTDIQRDSGPVGRAHQALFANHPPASTMVQIAALMDPDMRVEIEAEAFLPEAD